MKDVFKLINLFPKLKNVWLTIIHKKEPVK